VNHLLPAVIVYSLTGCSIIQPPLNLTEETAVYAEALFKRQNTLTQQIMMLCEDELTPVEMNHIEQAELQMHRACQPLNQYAEYETEQVETSFFFRQKVLRSLNACEASVKSMSLILINIQP